MISAAEPRKANQCIADAKRLKPAAALFDEFWREGELALLFGAQGTGKSILAVQIADAVARGTPLPGFRMPRGRRKVLYVDMDLSDAQFRSRYPAFRFPERFYRGRPPANVDLCEWVRTVVSENGFQAVIIDSLSAIKRTHDGVRETLSAMRRLKQIRDELSISILVISDAFEPTDTPRATVDDLKRSRVLCTVADNVFAMGRKRWPEGGRYIEQLRTRGGTIGWNFKNAPVATIKQLDSGLLGFEFDERFSPQLDDETRRLVCLVDELHESGETFRSIAATLGISKSHAYKLWKKWKPLIEVLSEKEDDDDNYEYYDEELESSPPYKGGVAGASPDGVVLSDDAENHLPADAVPLLRKEGSLNSGELSIGFDGYGQQILVESRDEYTGKPTVWYQFDAKGNKLRHERGAFSITVEHLNAGNYL